jgi:glycosyltransferase involved in cell wall biosynthesis
MPDRTSVALVHNKVMPYREPLFRRLSNRYDITYFITDEQGAVDDFPHLDIVECGPRLLYSKLKKDRFDIIIAPEYMTAPAWVCYGVGKLTSTPVIQWTEIWNEPTKSPFLDWLHRQVVTLTSLFSQGYIVPGSPHAKYLRQIIGSAEVYTAPNATHIELKEGKTPPPSSPDSDQFTILFLGKVIERKGVHVLLNAVKKSNLPANKVSLIIAGDGDPEYKDFLKELSIPMDIPVHFTGWLSSEQVASLYKQASIYVLPSNSDPWAISVVEAMQMETPVIVTNAVGCADDLVIEGETGYIVPVNNTTLIAKRLNELHSNLELRKMMAEKASRVASQKASFDKMEEGFIKAIERIA